MKLEVRSLHVAALASIAIVQPLFDMLARSPEFLLAHDLGPAEIMALTGILGIALPFSCSLIVALLHRIHPASARAAATGMAAIFVALITLYAAKHLPGTWPPFALAVAFGAGAAALYHRVHSVRAFATWLVPGIVVIPLIFILRPGVQRLVWPQEHQLLASSASATPVVFVVFDGLPLTALLDEAQHIDRELYPAFAALADQSTWYRNATTVSDYTQWALPAIVSGQYPVPRSLPIASDHRETLFTMLGSSHEIAVHEPITRLCPQSLCDHGGDGIANELREFAEPLSVAYLHALLPEQIRSTLPAVDQGWAEGVPPSEKPGEMWLRGGDHSRRGEVLAFINSIVSDGDGPSLHFLHVLLPHIPLAYLPDGQRYGTERVLPGLLDTRDRWEDDEWAATQGYRRFLLQVGYVDTILGQLVDRLKDVGLYDRALVIVTSDHGGSFRAGRAFRRLTEDTVMDIAPVPLLIKAPHQRAGVTSDRNVETVDILPTVADLMKVEPPWRFDGVSAIRGDVKRGKTIYYNGAKQRKRLPDSLTDSIASSVAHKVALFGAAGNRYRIPLDSPQRDLIGRDVGELRVLDAPEDVDFSLDVHGDFSHVDPQSRFLPAQLAGRARWTGSRDRAIVAIAVNGIVRATTWTYRYPQRGSDGAWAVVIAPDAFRYGENDVEIYLVGSGADAPVLYRTPFSHARPVNLLSNAAAYGMGTSYEGLYDREGTGELAIRWTNGSATIAVPRNRFPAARSMRINLAAAGAEKGLVVRVNGCELFEGRVPAARWSRIFALPACGQDAGSTIIELRSSAHVDPSGRELGVAVERIDLLDHPWPPPTASPSNNGHRSMIRFASGIRDGQTVESTERISVTVANRGESIWATPADLGHEQGAVRLGVLWLARGRTAQPAGIQRIELPRALVPGDTVDVTFDLVPRAIDGKALPPGEYEAWIGMLQEGVSWFYTSGDSVRKLRVVHDARS